VRLIINILQKNNKNTTSIISINTGIGLINNFLKQNPVIAINIHTNA